MKKNPLGSFVLADASGVAKTVYGLLHDGFYSGDFVDLATILETGILRDIALVPGGRAVPEAMFEPIRQLFDEGVVTLLAERPRMIWEPPPGFVPERARPEGYYNAKRSKLADAQLEGARIASAEFAHNRPAMVLTRQRDCYIAMARPPEEHWACDLRAKHASLADALFALKSRTRTPRLILAKVPPFAHLLLSRAENFDQVIDGMLELRWKCRRLRAAESALYEQLSSHDVSWLKKMKEQERFLRGWDQMIAACGEASTAEMEFGNSGAHLLRHLKHSALAILQGEEEELLHHGRSLLQKFLESISVDDWEQTHACLVRPVRTAAWKYLNTPDRAMYDAAHRVFKAPRKEVEVRMSLLVNSLGQHAERAA
jgi:hypothetical protein